MSMYDLSAYMDVFMEEADELLLYMDTELMRMESEGLQEEMIHGLFRAAHTLKGSSAAMGFQPIAHLTHELEHLLDHVRNDRLTVTSPMMTLLYACVDRLKAYRDQLMERAELVEADDLIEQLRTIILTAAHADADRQLFQSDHAPASANRLLIRLSESSPMKLARAHLIVQSLSAYGAIQAIDPPISLIAEQDMPSELRVTFTAAGHDLEQVVRELQTMVDVDRVVMLDDREEVSATPAVSSEEKQHAASRNHKLQSIRVDVARLESLINLVGELMIDHSRIEQLQQLIRQEFPNHPYVAELSTVCSHASQVMIELQDGVMKSRMLPVDYLFARFPRMLRDLADGLGKRARLEISGKETELDRTVIEEIGDPLIHLLRNAIDHGIEMPEERRLAGKPEEGIIRISAVHEENQVVIRIIDDGKGIDTGVILEKAIEKGVVTEEEGKELSEQDIMMLIFRPGFSTSQQITDVSGRGVGMDIVLTHIEKIGGLIQVESKPGKETMFTIKLPLTLAIISGLLVEVSKQVYIIPMTNVVEIIRITSDQLESAGQYHSFEYRGGLLPLKHLNRLLDIEGTDSREGMQYLVIIGLGDKKAALVVDRLIGNQEIVVKSLGRIIANTKGVTASTILGNGHVGFILDVQDLIQRSV